MRRVKLLVCVMAWRHRDQVRPANRSVGGPLWRFLSPSEELWRYAPGVVKDRDGRTWKVSDNFLGLE